jgi:putative transposase
MNTAGSAPSRRCTHRLPGSGTIRVKRKLNSTEVIDALTDLFILRGTPAYIRSDNGPEFIAEAVRDWVKAVGAKTAYIEPGSP